MTLFAGRFDMIKLLGRGGMAEAWLAEQKGLRGFTRRVVIKQMLRHLAEDREFVRRFEDEARIAGLVNHTNVVRVEDFGEEAGIPYLVMEFIEGQDLVALSERAHAEKQKLPIRFVVQVGMDIARGLHAVHHLTDFEGNPLNVVHRDVSPQNIVVDLDGHAKLLDFGVARAATNRVKTRVGILKGKIAYFSPEQSRGDPLDGRSDQFALAVVLWELLTGHRLFLGATDIATLRRVRRGTIPNVLDECPNAPANLVETLNKALHPELLRRFEDGNAFATHLERCLSDLGGRLEGDELRAILADLQRGDRRFLPSIPLPDADEETSFSTISEESVVQTNPSGKAVGSESAFDEDPLTVVSQPGFLADFEDEETLLSQTSIPPGDLSALRSLADEDVTTTRDGFQADTRSEAVEYEATPPARTRETVTVKNIAVSPEYTDHSSLGGPWLSLALLGAIIAIAVAVLVL